VETIAEAVRSIGAKRVVIDSLAGFELALAPAFREDVHEGLYAMVGALVGLGVTVMMTAEIVESYTELRLAPRGFAFLTDAIILQRYVELAGNLRKCLVVAKMRGCDHSSELKRYDIDDNGIVIGETLTACEGLLIGGACRISDTDRDKT